MVTIVSGARGSGKSGYLLRLAEEYKLKNTIVGGIVSRSIWENGGRTGYEAVDLFTGESWLLASSRPAQDKNIFYWGQWHFRQNAFNEGNAVIANFINNYAEEKNAVLFIDEIGKIELEGKGWDISLLRANAHRVMNTVLGVRLEIVNEIKQLAGGSCTCQFMDSHNNAIQ